MAQRDYVSRGKRAAAAKAKARRNTKKTPRPLPIMAIGLAAALVAGIAGGVYYVKNRDTDAALNLQQQIKHKNGLPVKPEERWSYIKELENKEVVISDPHNPMQDRTAPTQLTAEQQAILTQLQTEMQQAPQALPRADRNGNIEGETQITQNKPVYTSPNSNNQGQPIAKIEQIPPRQTTSVIKESKPTLVQPPPIPRGSETAKNEVAKVETAKKVDEKPQQWLVQCGAYRTSSQAEEVQATLAFQGIEANLRTSNSWHRVVLGPYSSRAAADKQQNRLKSSGMSSCLILPVQG
ncbi:MAG: cell division protein FtsN [Plesiomonas sp.]